MVQKPPADAGDMNLILGSGRSPEEETAADSSILASLTLTGLLCGKDRIRDPEEEPDHGVWEGPECRGVELACVHQSSSSLNSEPLGFCGGFIMQE